MTEKTVTISIRGKDREGDDAPLVGDVLDQIRDFTVLLKAVGSSIDGDKKLSWRMIDAHKNSPLAFDLAPLPNSNMEFVGVASAEVILATIEGLGQLQENEALPDHFDENAQNIAARIFKRVTNGLATTSLDAKGYEAIKPKTITQQSAHIALANLSALKAPEPPQFRELGSLEGVITAIELDGHGRPIMQIKSRIDGQKIKCVFADGLDRIGHYEVGKVLEGLRIRAFGELHYKGAGNVTHMAVNEVNILDDLATLPSIDDIVSPNFTNGLIAESYLSKVHDYV